MDGSMRLSWLAGLCIAAGLLGACSNAQSRKTSYMAHGKAYLAAGNYDKARVEFSNAAQIDPRDAEVRTYLGQVAENIGDMRGAVAQYQAAISDDPKQVAARVSLGRLFLAGGLPNRAMELAESGLVLAQKSPQLLTVRGAARARLGNAPGALEDAQTAVQLAPDDPYAVALLASLYKQHSELDKAITLVQTALQRLPTNTDLNVILADLFLARQQPAQSEAQLRRIIVQQPQNVMYRYSLAGFYLQQKNVDAAEKTLREAVSGFPENRDAKLQLVRLLAAQRTPEEAAAQVDRFLAAEPTNDKLKLLLGGFLAEINHVESAERVYRAVITHAGTGPDGLAARDRLASLLFARKDLPAASALVAEVLKENAGDNDALIERADIALVRGQAQAAIRDLRAVLRDQPTNLELMRTLARAYRQNDEGDLAEQTLRAAVQISPTDFQSRLDLAQVLIGSSKLEEAEPLLAQLAKENPSTIAVQESLFRTLAAQQSYVEARAVAQNIERLSPNQGLGYYLAGVVDELEQKPDVAANDYEQSLQRQPNAAEPLAALVGLDMRLKRAPAAMSLVDRLIVQSPSNLVARKLKSELLLSQGQKDAAIAVDQDLVRAAPGWPEGYEHLALAQGMARRPDDAIQTLKLGIEKTHGASSLIRGLSRLYEGLGRAGEAIALYDGVLAKNPNSSFAANNLAVLLVTYRQDAASLARAQSLCEQLAASSEVSAIDTRGWVKFKSGDFRGAESLLQRAVDEAPTEPELRYHLGMAQLRSDERQLAQQNLETALSFDRPFAGRDEAKAALVRLRSVVPTG
jgi:tetratricopeptide (TPR) repeat protein